METWREVSPQPEAADARVEPGPAEPRASCRRGRGDGAGPGPGRPSPGRHRLRVCVPAGTDLSHTVVASAKRRKDPLKLTVGLLETAQFCEVRVREEF